MLSIDILLAIACNCNKRHVNKTEYTSCRYNEIVISTFSLLCIKWHVQ